MFNQSASDVQRGFRTLGRLPWRGVAAQPCLVFRRLDGVTVLSVDGLGIWFHKIYPDFSYMHPTFLIHASYIDEVSVFSVQCSVLRDLVHGNYPDF